MFCKCPRPGNLLTTYKKKKEHQVFLSKIFTDNYFNFYLLKNGMALIQVR